jgi:pimeloyl-ACP methyl ester carboxylesterase
VIEPRRERLRYPEVDVWSAGEGPPVVMLHGWGLSGRAYRPALSALGAKGYRVVAPSVAVLSDGWTMARLVDRTADALYACGVAQATVVGHSFGGALGVALAVREPELVSSLVLVDAFVVSPGARNLARIALPGPHWRIGTLGATALALGRSAVSDGGLRSLARSARWVLRRSLEDEAASLGARGVPSEVLWAERDTLLPLWLGRRTATALGAPLEVIPPRPDGWPLERAPDHDWPMRAPAFFADRIDAALRRLGGAS